MAVHVEIKGGDKLLTKLKKMSKMAAQANLTVGFYKNARYPKEEGEKGDPPYVAQVAYWNNFGTISNGGFTPPRPFFTQTINEKRQSWFNGFGKELVKNEYNVEKAARRLGEQARADVQEKIREYPGTNAKSTLEAKRKKGGRNLLPLKDTLLMHNSVGYSYNDESPQYSQNSD